VRQVGHYIELYRDALSTERKSNRHSCTRTGHEGVRSYGRTDSLILNLRHT